ncbi:zinc finger protein ZAT5-like [Papaver somniferum]|uniref:zinc finger protein ZAT5-like n=1 Tax=Papaver somniferum TaxID=3469 RepID=UPI000E702F0E|nr:zinc finger protein ZAT5-like [Papaver somniferum]
MTKIRIKVDNNYKFVGFSMQENGIQNNSIDNSGSDIKEKSSPSTSDGKRNSPSISDAQRNSPSTSDAQRNSPSTYDAQRNSPSTSDAQRNSPSTSDAQRNSPSTSCAQRNSPSTSDAQRNSPSTSCAPRSFSTTKKSNSHEFPQSGKTAKRGRKSSSTSTSSVEKLSIDKQKESVFGEKELVETLMHLWALSNSYSIDSAKSKKHRSTKFSITKKRKLQDVVCTEDGLKKHQQITTLSSASDTFSCAFCEKSFNSYQALGGHKSSCKSNPLKKEVVKPAVQDSSATSKIHPCKICGKVFLSGCALGGHQKSHKTGEVEPSRSSASPPPKEINESLHLIKSSTTSVQEEQADVPNKKIMMFDLNEKPPEDDDESELKL